MIRKIPTSMATQHPDHANMPYWHNDPFISTQFESEELFLAFSKLGIGEYKWDWEGKLVDESVLERLFSNHLDFFKKHPLGFNTYLTFRLPNPKLDSEFRIGRAFMNLASAASIAKHFKLPSPPLFEVILPMTKSAEEILAIQQAYQNIHFLKHRLYRLENILTNLRVIPLFEDVDTIINSDKILEKYIRLYEKRFKKRPQYLRPYVARSDPALNHGIVPTVLGIKIALSRYTNLEKRTQIPMFPIIGAGSLTFRGGLTPKTVEKFASEYKGVRTTTIQSAFRYDYPLEDVKKGIKKLNVLLRKFKAVEITSSEQEDLQKIIPVFDKYYKQVIEKIAPLINKIAGFLPQRRERVQHTGLFGYTRGIGKVKLPRAIAFTGSLYSIGIPPELIGTGRGLRSADKLKKLELIKKHYRFILEDMVEAGRFLNKDNLEKLAENSKAWQYVTGDIKDIEKIFNITLGPRKNDDHRHKKLTGQILNMVKQGQNPKELITKAAVLRQSLG